MQYWETIADKLSVTGKSSESQTGGVLAQFLITSLTLGIGKAIDAAALVGSGVSGQPLGIFNRSGSVSSVTFGAAATWATSLPAPETRVSAFIERARKKFRLKTSLQLRHLAFRLAMSADKRTR